MSTRPHALRIAALLLIFATTVRAQPEALALPFAADRSTLAERVREEFLHAWLGYVAYAWGFDELRPLSKTGTNWYETSLLMTPVDAYSTLRVMDLDGEATRAKSLILERLTFDLDMEVQVFEVNIRLLGGLLSAYQLDGDARFLALARDLADRLLPAFDSATGLPYRYVNLLTGMVRDAATNPAEIGTYILEFGTLSKHTGDPKYRDAAMRAIRKCHALRSEVDLVGTVVNVETGAWIDETSHVGARIDSYYEYLLKGAILFDDDELRGMWETHVAAVNELVADEVEGALWYGQVDMHSGVRSGTYFGALDAFFPGVLALGGDLPRAARLQESCYRLWTLHGIEPEWLNYRTMEVVYPNYVLRPENIESAYVLFHFTKDERYLEMGRQYFESLVEHCRTPAGYAALASVITMKKSDSMQSFFLAETLKYAYLLFAPDGTIDFETTVFNTEAHPLRVWRD